MSAIWALASGLVAGAAASDEFPNPRYTGAMAIREWSEEEVQGATQTFSITQAEKTGLIYVGGSDGVLEYDGVRWRTLPLLSDLPGQGVRGLLVDGRGRIWAGLDNEVLRYTVDDRGRWQAESMLSRVPESERAVGTVWQLHEVAGMVWGTGTRCVLRFERDGTGARVWPRPVDLVTIGVTEGKIWFRQTGGELFWAEGDTIEAAKVPALPGGAAALAIYRTPTGALRIDHTRGVLELAEGEWRAVAPALARLLQGEGAAASRARRLPDGRGIFSTRSRSLIFVAPEGQVLGRFDEPPGVTFGVTPQTHLDRDGGLWMANANGIRRVQVDGVVARHDRALGLRGDVRDLVQDGSTILAATAQGLFAREPVTGKFEQRSRGLSDLFDLAPSPAGGWLIAAGGNFREWNEENVVLPGAPRSGVALTCDPHDPARVFVNMVNEVGVFRRQKSEWVSEARLGGIKVAGYSVAMSDRGELWVGGGFDPGLWRAVAPAGDWSKAKLELVSLPGVSAPAIWHVARVEGDVVAYGVQGIFRFESETGRLVEDARFAGLPHGALTPVVKIAVGAKSGAIYVAGRRASAGRYWRGVPREAGAAWEWAELPLAEIHGQITPAAMLESADGNTLWLGGLKSAVSLDLRAAAPPPFPVPAARWRLVRALETAEVFFGGADERTKLDLPLGRRAVEFEYAAPAYRVHLGGETGIEFRTRATGVDADWTAWSKAGARELTNLRHGIVRLEVQARNHLRAEGTVAALELIVPPFWWETWWFRAVVVLVVVALVAAVVRGLVRRQFRQRIALLEAQAAVQNERLRIARDMHDDLGSTLASIVHLSGGGGTAGEKGEGTLARIHEASRDLVHRTRDIVWAATPQHDSLESLFEQLAAHAERTLGDRGVDVRVVLPVQVPEEPIEAAVRHGLFLAFKEAVNNAAKYAQARTASVRVELAATALVVTLADDGVGFAPGEKQGTGNGLGNLQARMAALGGSAEIVSVVGRGTTVTLRLPRGMTVK